MVPQIVSSEPFAWHHLPGIPADAAVCDGNTLAVIQDGTTTFIRTLETGDLQAQVAAIFTALSMSGVALPPCLLVFGERAEALLLTADMPVPVSRLELPDESVKVFRTETTFQQLAGLYAVAYGSHCGGLPDFRRGELAWTAGDARLRKKLRLAAVLTVVTVVLLFVSKGLQYRAVRADIASLDRSILSIYREVFPSRTKAVDELSEIKGEIRKLSGGDTAGTALDIIKVLAEAKGTTINGLYEAEVEGRILRLKGDARSAQAVNDFKDAISPLMTSVELGEVKSRPDGTVAFVLSGTIREAAK
jgi:general secretion pathway protein L